MLGRSSSSSRGQPHIGLAREDWTVDTRSRNAHTRHGLRLSHRGAARVTRSCPPGGFTDVPTSVLIVTILGMALIGLVVMLLLIEGTSALRGIAYQREQRRHSLILLDEQINAARALHVRNEQSR